jgi:hypothetical protein
MKVIISNTPPHFLDLDASTLSAEEVVIHGRTLWRVCCRFCDMHRCVNDPEAAFFDAECNPGDALRKIAPQIKRLQGTNPP